MKAAQNVVMTLVLLKLTYGQNEGNFMSGGYKNVFALAELSSLLLRWCTIFYEHYPIKDYLLSVMFMLKVIFWNDFRDENYLKINF